MKITMLSLCLAMTTSGFFLSAQEVSPTSDQVSDNWVGLTAEPTTILGVGYEKTWGNFSLGVSLGGYSWGQDRVATYFNPGVKASLMLNQWELSPDVRISLRGFAAIGWYYYSIDAAGMDQSSLGVGESGLEVQYLVQRRFRVGVSLGQSLFFGTWASGQPRFATMPLPGISLGLVF